jgi:hypothetical protein
MVSITSAERPVLSTPYEKDPSKPGGYSEKEEIMSHSAYLTNFRLSKIMEEIDRDKVQCWKNTKVENVICYFASTYALFDSIYFLMDPKNELKEVRDKFAEYWKLYVKVTQVKGEQKSEHVYAMLMLVDDINRKMKAVLQGYRYFFRTGFMDAKRIEDCLTVLKEKGGIFGTSGTDKRIHPQEDKPANG